MVAISKEETRFMKREKILIVDDDLDMLSLIDWHLNRLGYSTAVAVDGLEAMKRIGESKPDLVILNVLILSALSRPADRALALSAGANDYVTKPFDITDLVSRIGTIFNQYPR